MVGRGIGGIVSFDRMKRISAVSTNCRARLTRSPAAIIVSSRACINNCELKSMHVTRQKDLFYERKEFIGVWPCVFVRKFLIFNCRVHPKWISPLCDDESVGGAVPLKRPGARTNAKARDVLL